LKDILEGNGLQECVTTRTSFAKATNFHDEVNKMFSEGFKLVLQAAVRKGICRAEIPTLDYVNQLAQSVAQELAETNSVFDMEIITVCGRKPLDSNPKVE